VRWRGYDRYGVSDEELANTGVPLSAYPNLMRMVEEDRPVLVSDTFEGEVWVKARQPEWHGSYVAAPIRIGGRTEGFLNVNSAIPNHFTWDDAQRLQAFAKHAAIALQNAKLFRQQTRYADELEERVRERTAQLAARNARLKAILRSTSDGIIVTDGDGSIIQTNRVADMWLHQTLSSEDADQLRKAVGDLARRASEHPDTLIELTGLDLELRSSSPCTM
jgi:GAF domain-containing protein